MDVRNKLVKLAPNQRLVFSRDRCSVRKGKACVATLPLRVRHKKLSLPLSRIILGVDYSKYIICTQRYLTKRSLTKKPLVK